MSGVWRLPLTHACSTSLLLWMFVGWRAAEAAVSQQGIPLSVVKLWASAFGGEIKSISAKYSGSQLLQKELWAITAPRPGTNSSSEGGGLRGGRMNARNCPWEESLTPRGPRRHGESVQVAFRKRLQAPNLSPPCPETFTFTVFDLQKHKEFVKTVKVEEIDGMKLVKNLAVKMEEVFQKKAEATRVSQISHIFHLKRYIYPHLLGLIREMGCSSLSIGA
ncbi:unnamed protein product [Tetraodon nigroviridis]|uniref:Chromosome 11 SCAF14979, whole genome shotgun sequence n=1 Tax=Tetraodon nigroviridis TaxID=99883 RepID=Q4RXK5_TETNG|nr:unnamed protein product [Tetraodon nigroviridis]